jgi:2'-5' RNA ligase
MRCFVAVEIDNEIRKGLAKLQDELQAKADVGRGDVKWVDPRSIHLTLKFLGEIRDNQLVEVSNIVKDVAGRHKGFSLEVKHVGSFGGSSARVLWVGAGEDCTELLQLQAELEEKLEVAGWPKEARQFAAHLTLCRIKNAKAGFKMAQLAEGYKDYEIDSLSVDSICVYESQLKPEGPIYTVLGRYQLK